MHGVFSALGRKAPLVVAGAAVFLAGGVFVPKVVEATTSSGDRAIFEPLAPARILDTRFGPSPLAVGTPVGAGATIEVQVRGQGGVPNDATAVALNVTVTGATQQSHLTVFPGGEQAPNASNLNFGAGDTIPNAVTAKIGTNGKVAIRNNSGTVHVIADVNGYFRGHTHDDRYDTKAQVDTKIDNAQAESNYVGSGQITDGQVGNADLGGNSVTSNKVADGAVGNADLANNAVDAGKIADGQVGSAELGAGSVVAGKVGPDAVTGDNVDDGTLGLRDLTQLVRTSTPNFSNLSVSPTTCLFRGVSVSEDLADETDVVVARFVTDVDRNFVLFPASIHRSTTAGQLGITYQICNSSNQARTLNGPVTIELTVYRT